MSRIGFKPSYLGDDNGEAPSMPPIQEHVVEGKDENQLLLEAKDRLLQAKVFILKKAFARLTDKAKARKLQEMEFLTLVVAQLS